MCKDVKPNADCKCGAGIMTFGLMAKELYNPRVIEVTRAGVVQLPSECAAFTVNEENLEDFLKTEIRKRKPEVDCYGGFAAKVTIRVELLGDLQED